MTMKELLAEKHPTCWIEFEMGQLTEDEVIKKFFADGRDFDIQGGFLAILPNSVSEFSELFFIPEFEAKFRVLILKC